MFSYKVVNMNCSMPGFHVHHHFFLEFVQVHVHWVSDVSSNIDQWLERVTVGSYDIYFLKGPVGGIVLDYLQKFYIHGGLPRNQGHNYLLRAPVEYLWHILFYTSSKEKMTIH